MVYRREGKEEGKGGKYLAPKGERDKTPNHNANYAQIDTNNNYEVNHSET